MTDESVYQYKVYYGGLQPLSYWAKGELVPGQVIDTPGHPLKVLRVTVPAGFGIVGEAEAERLPV
jgi:hypothetical protein